MYLFLDNKGKKGAAKEVSGEAINELQVVDPTNTYYLIEPVLLKSSIGKIY